MPPLKTRCPDTEAPPDGEAARLALDEYFKDADWNLVDSGNEHDDPEVLDVECEHPPIGAFMIDPEAQDAGMPPLSEQPAQDLLDTEETNMTTYKVLLEQMTPLYTLVTISAANGEDAVEAALEQVEYFGHGSFVEDGVWSIQSPVNIFMPHEDGQPSVLGVCGADQDNANLSCWGSSLITTGRSCLPSFLAGGRRYGISDPIDGRSYQEVREGHRSFTDGL